MLHLAAIQQEFLKQARTWKDLTLDEQKKYLRRHPGSKRKLTAKPGSAASSQKLETVRGIKRIFSRVKKLDALSTKAEKKGLNLKRNKVYWKLEKAITTGQKPAFHGDVYNMNPIGSSYNEEANQAVTKRVNRLVTRITDATNKVLYAQPNRHMEKDLREGILNYVKKHYLIERKVAPPKKIEDLKKKFKAKVNKTKKKPDYFQVGHRVRLSNGVEVTITGIKHGHKYTTVFGDTDEGQHWHSKQRNGDMYRSSTIKYIGKTSEEDKQKHVKNRRDFDRSLMDDKLKRKVQGRNKVEELNIQPGNTISIKGSHYNWQAKVVSVDWKQGGVRIDQQRQRRQRGGFGSYPGLFSGGTVTTHYRFIPAGAIVDVVKRHD
jgi:hypothetical protein